MERNKPLSFQDKLKIEATSFAKKYGISESEAAEMIQNQYLLIQDEGDENPKPPQKGIGEQALEYGYNTLTKPAHRLAQLATKGIASLPGMVDFGHYLFHNQEGEEVQKLQDLEMRGSPVTVDKDKMKKEGEETAEKRKTYTPLGWADKTEKAITRFNKDYLMLDPVENEFGETANNIISAVTSMPMYAGAGNQLSKLGNFINRYGKSSDLGKTGKKAVELAAKVPEKVGSFLKGGSNIKSPIEVGANLGSVSAPYLIPEDERGHGNSFLVGMAGGLAGGKLTNKAMNMRHKNKPLTRMMEAQTQSDAGKIDSMFKDAGVDSYIYNTNPSAPIQLAAKKAEYSLFGNKTREALENQRDQISKQIEPNYKDAFNRSELGEELRPHLENQAKSYDQYFKDSFDKIRADANTKTDAKVSLGHTHSFLKDLIQNVGTEEGAIKLFMTSPVGQEYQMFYKDGLRNVIDEKLKAHEQGTRGTKSKTQQQIELENVRDMLNKDLEYGKVTVNGVQMDVDPVLKKILSNEYLKHDLLINSPRLRDSISYNFADAMLRRVGAKDGLFKSYFTDAEQGALKGLYGALREDVKSSIGQKLAEVDPAAAVHMERTLKEFGDFSKRDKYDFNKMMQLADDDPIKFVNTVMSDRSSSGNKFKLITDNMYPQEATYFRQRVNRLLGSPHMGNNQPFDPIIWKKRFTALDKSVAKKLYGQDLPKLQSIANVISELEKVHAFENKSGTAKHLINAGEVTGTMYAAKVIGTQLINGDWKAAAVTALPLIATVAGDALLGSKRFNQYYVKFKNAQSVNEALLGLRGMEKMTTKRSGNVMIKNMIRVFDMLDKDVQRRGREEEELKRESIKKEKTTSR